MLAPKDVTIGISTRERDRLASAVIGNLKAKTPEGPRILFVDADVAPKYRVGIYEALAAFGPHSIIQVSEYLLPIQATDSLIAACETPVLALIENDVWVPDNWLDPVLEELNSGANFVSPVILEAHQFPIDTSTRVVHHFNPERSSITENEDRSLKSDVKRVPSKDTTVDLSATRPVKHLERHAFFGLTEAFRQIAPFPDFLNTREQIVMALRIHQAGLGIVLRPDVAVTYVELPLELEEIDHYLLRWDIDRAQSSNDFVQQNYNLVDYKSSMIDVQGRVRRALALRPQLMES